ncbi:putative ribonuclease H-like domain-containing protein [Tanacetum coccineum]|uniref:Ribonuclease H-like domain-containing protein n=1 Tax=Tanacetum coccineum TaxID=301880 RepID=A0ABQ4XHS4_9ASTR
MSGTHDEIPPPPPPPQETQQKPTQQTPQTVSTIKLPILKKGEYDIWAMKMSTIWAPYQYYPIGRFGGNDESKKMQKYILKQQFEGFTVSNSDGIHKGYERFQSYSVARDSWSSLSFDDLYNNLRVFENDVKGSTASSSNLQNIAFVSENTNSTNEVSTAYGSFHFVSTLLVDEYDLEGNGLKGKCNDSPWNKQFQKKICTVGENVSLLLSPQQVVNGGVFLVVGKMESGRTWGKEIPHRTFKEKGIIDSGCFQAHDTETRLTLRDYSRHYWWPGFILVAISGGSRGYIMGKVLFTDTECLILSPDFKLPDENQILLKVPRQNNMYSFNLENIVPLGGLACLIAKATFDESNLWHRRLGHKGKQHKASCKAKTVSSISHSLQLLHMDLFGPTSVRSLNHKTYCLVITDDFSRFSWVFFLRTKDETSGILKDFIRQIENQLNQKVKTIRCDNGTEFKNKDVIEFCGSKGIKREYSNARTPQQNGVAERKNRTLIEAARTMLADSFLPNTFWAEAVSTACYVLNRVLVTKPHNKTPYELLTGKIPIISYIRPFGCHVTILNTIDHLGKFAGKSDEGFLVGYSLQSKAFRVYNLETKRVEENLHITFLENKPNVAGKGPTWLFDLDYLTDSMNYHPVRSENQANLHAGQQEANQNAGTKAIIDVRDSDIEDESAQDCFVLPLWPSYSSKITPVVQTDDKREGPREEEQVFMDELERLKRQEKEAEALRKNPPAKASSTNLVNTVSIPVSTASLLLPILMRDYLFLIQQILKKMIRNYSIEDIIKILMMNEPKKISEALEDESWVDAHLQEEIAGIYQMDVKSAFLYGKIDEENGYRRGTIDKTLFIKKDKHDIILVQVYVDDIIFGSTKKSWCDEFEALMKSKFQMSSMGELTFFLGLQVKQKEDGIFISQDKYVAEILKKFDFANVKTASTPIETQKPLVKDEEASDVDVHLYRSMIGSLMYLTASRPDIMFAVCACSRFQVTPKSSHLSAVKRIFRYLKGKPKLGLWYPRVSSFDLESYSDSDYAGANLDRKSTTGGCQFLGRRLISWQCKKQTIVATSTTEAEYVAAASCCGQVLKIHTDDNVADLLTKAFDVSRFQFLVVNIGMINP